MPDPANIETARGAAARSGSRRVRDVMRRDFITISREETLFEALQLMRVARLRHLAVVSGEVLVGILSYRDLQDELIATLDSESPAARAPGFAKTGLAEHLRGLPFSIVPDATLIEAAARLERLRVGCLPVVEADEKGPRLVGVLTEMDLLRAAYGV